MSLKVWQLRPTELRPLGTEALLVLGARSALRVEPFVEREALATWKNAFALLLAPAPDGAALGKMEKLLGALGARAANARAGARPEALGRCMNHATSALAALCALAAAPVAEVAAYRKGIADAVMYAGSIPALVAHAGLVPGSVPELAGPYWSAVRSDLPVLASLANLPATKGALAKVAPLWPEGPPLWLSAPSL